MGKLVFIGTGLRGNTWITLEGIRRGMEVKYLYGEFYTSYLGENSIKKLEKTLGREIKLLTRNELESGEKIFNSLLSGDVGILVGGDPMAATTHIELRLEAERRGYKTEVVYGVSIIVAAPSAIGLQHYKFGRIVSVPWVTKSFMPHSVLDIIKNNLSIGLHTLLLLDLKDGGEYMSINEALKILLLMEKEANRGVVEENTLVIGAARIGYPDCFIKGGTVKELLKTDFGNPLHIMVIPGSLHFMEEEALIRIAQVKEETLRRWKDMLAKRFFK